MAQFNKQTNGVDHVVKLLPSLNGSDDGFDPKSEKGEETYKRHQWASKREYILSAVGYCVGVGNLWRFPYICIRNGGGKFLFSIYFFFF